MISSIKLLYINTGTHGSQVLGSVLVNGLQDISACSFDVDTVEASAICLHYVIGYLTQYDIVIFDGTIEADSELRDSIYDILDKFILLRDNFWVVTRNTLPMNVVPLHSNICKFDALRNNMYQIDSNRLDSSAGALISDKDILRWVKDEMVRFLDNHDGLSRPENVSEMLMSVQSDVRTVMSRYDQKDRKSIFVSFRGRYQENEYYGYNVASVKRWIKEVFHKDDSDEWNEPFTYDSGSLTNELMPEQRVWTVQSIISSKIQECDEFWIFETLQEKDADGNIVHFSYWDSWWCVAEVMEVLNMNARGTLNKDFKLIVFNPCLPDKYEVIPLEQFPKLTSFEERELMRLKNEGNIERSNLHLREDKRDFRNSSWLMKKLRYKSLCVQWNRISKMNGVDISIPFDLYVEDVNCHVYDDEFLTQRIYMDAESMEVGRCRADVLREGYCKHFLNLCSNYEDTPQYEGIYTVSTEELESCVQNGLPVIMKRTDGDEVISKELLVERYGMMYFFWQPLLNPLSPGKVKRSGPYNRTVQEIPLYKIKAIL